MKRQANKKTNTKPINKSKNGKGDSPRNISEEFKKNYEKINWKKK